MDLTKIVECVPNFSEGRREDVIEEIVRPFRETDGVYLLDYEKDPNHNRLVVTVIGVPDKVKDAVFQATKTATRLIDMEKHQGEHPRIGATDVIPFIPIRGMTMDEAVTLAHELGEKIAKELQIPVYFYEEAARLPKRKNLEVIRKGQYEGLKEEISKPERAPDVGPQRMHPTAGATVVGARGPLIAFNVNLGTNDIEIAKKIARFVRHSSGGFRYVKAIGVSLSDRGIVQVSMNLTNYEKTAIYRVFELIKIEADRWGVPVVESEIVGLVPGVSLFDSLSYYLKLKDFSPEKQVMELRLLEML